MTKQEEQQYVDGLVVDGEDRLNHARTVQRYYLDHGTLPKTSVFHATLWTGLNQPSKIWEHFNASEAD